MTILGVNVDHVATIREARKAFEPDPVMASTLAILGGADGITVHLREDRRHIRDRDLHLLREVVRIELNLEMAATEEMIRIARQVGPDMVTLVPEKRQELTTEGGLDILGQREALAESVKRIRDSGTPVSLFIDPDVDSVEVSREIGADMVEIHTGLYANARGRRQDEELVRVVESVSIARTLGLLANAGHGLDYSNVRGVAGIRGIRGLYIGHSIVARAVLVGFEQAVREMKKVVRAASGPWAGD